MARLVALTCLLAFATSSSFSQTYHQQTTNNTAACSAANYGLLGSAYCADQFPSSSWPYPGWKDLSSSYVETPVHDPSVAATWNISKGRGASENPPAATDLHSLLYGGGVSNVTTQVVMETQGWFCNPSESTCRTDTQYSQDNQTFQQYYSHNDVKYTAWNQNTVDARTVDMWDRGVDVVAMDWSGGQNNCPPSGATQYPLSSYTSSCPQGLQNVDIGYQNMLGSMQSTLPSLRSGANMKFYLQYDASAYQYICPSNTYQPQCVQNKIIADIDYAQTGANEASVGSYKPYLSQSDYATYNNKRIFAFFQYDPGLSICGFSVCYLGSNGSSPCSLQSGSSYVNCWDAVYDAVRSHLGSVLGTNNFYMTFYHQGGCTHRDADGCYGWVTAHEYDVPANITASTQQYQNYNDSSSGVAWIGQRDLRDFYYTAQHQPSTAPNGSPFLIMGAAYKGFDDRDAFPWGKLRILSQNCGQTWLDSFKEMTWDSNTQTYDANGFYSGTHQLAFLLVSTWDDYEEGSEVETGISNCGSEGFGNPSISAPSAQLSWSGPSGGNTNTYDHYTIWATADGNNLIDLGTACTSCGYTLTSNILNAGTYNIYVQEVSKASLTNHMSAAVSYTPSIVTISPSSYTYTSTGSTTFTIKNTGQYNVTVYSVTASPSSNFSAATNCNGQVLGPNQTCSLSVSGTVPSSGSVNGTLTANHNGANGVTTAALVAQAPTNLALTVSPNSLSFGSESIGQTSAPQVVTLSSTGTQAVYVSSFGISGDFNWNTSGLSNPCPAPPFNLSSSCTVNITFTPTQNGNRTGTFTIQDNAPGNPHTVSLSGTGGCPSNTVCNIDDMAGWQLTSGSTSSSLTQNVPSPALDGGSAQFSMFDTTAYAGSKWENMLGANDSASHFTLDLQVYFQNPNAVQSVNFGMSQMYSGGDYAFHFECDFKSTGYWNVWNAASNSWSLTAIACTPFAANTWVHLTFDAQRVNGQLQYNWLKVNGTQYNINQTFNPNSESPDNVEVGITLYEDSHADSYSMWIDSMNLTESPQ